MRENYEITSEVTDEVDKLRRSVVVRVSAPDPVWAADQAFRLCRAMQLVVADEQVFGTAPSLGRLP